jgi:hypothetical protein
MLGCLSEAALVEELAMNASRRLRSMEGTEVPTMVEEAPQSHWLIVKYCLREMQVLALRLDSGEEVLPVFSSGEAAATFLRHLPRCLSQRQRIEDGWYVRESTTGELTSLLFGTCRSVDHVALDLRPETASEGLSATLLMRRKDFVASE